MPTLAELLMPRSAQAQPMMPPLQPQAAPQMPQQPSFLDGIREFLKPRGSSAGTRNEGIYPTSQVSQPITLAGLLGIGSAQAADTPFKANRGTDSYVAPPAYVGQSVMAQQDTGNQAKAAALSEAGKMGPPPTWGPAPSPAIAAARMQRWNQLQAIIHPQQR